MTASPIPTADWATQQAHWTAVYAAQLPAQLRRVIAFVHARRADPSTLAPHFDSLLTLLDRAAAAGEDVLWLELVAVLHPLPLRWRRWEEWGRVLEQATQRAAAAGDHPAQAAYLAALADLQRQRGRLDHALSIAQEALDLATAARAPFPLAEAGSTAVAALRFQGRTAEAQALLAAAQRRLDVLAAPPAAPLPHALLALQRMDLLRATGHLAQAVALADALVNNLETAPHPHPHQMGMVYRRRATIYWAASRYPAAARDLERSAVLFEQAGDPLQALFSRGNLGLVYYGMARYDDAEAAMREVIAAGEALNAHWRLMRDLGNLCGVYFARGRLDTALIYAQRHLDLATRFGDAAEQSRAASNRACIYMYQGRAAPALPELCAVYERFCDQERSEGIISALADLTVAHHLAGDSAAARACAEEIFTRPQIADYPVPHILGLRARALTDEPPQAAAALRDALALARQHGRLLDEAGCLLSLAALAADPARRDQLWEAGVALLQEIGAAAWLDGRSAADPPLVALLL